MDGLSAFYAVLQDSGTFLDESQQQDLDSAVYQCLANYSKLAHLAMMSGQVRWNIVQKHHMMAHIPTFAKIINPRMVSTYVEESFIAQGPTVCKEFSLVRARSMISHCCFAVFRRFSRGRDKPPPILHCSVNYFRFLVLCFGSS